MGKTNENLSLQRMVFLIAILLFGIKMTAWLLTGSLAILTDALESVVNIIAGGIGLYSMYISSKPRDADHPYGHGKAELLSSGAEGAMILGAGIFIIYKSIQSFFLPHELAKLNWGILLISITAIINFATGYYCVLKGKKNNSLQLIASGKHLKTDTYSTLAIVAGLTLVYATGFHWMDSILAGVVAIIILITGYKILRVSIAGIMDEADRELLERMVEVLNKNRPENWIDLHNLRFIKYGNRLHCDCHLTVPWYLNVREAHTEVETLRNLIQKEFGTSVELFVHLDPCMDYSCAICNKQNCMVRKHPFTKRITWTIKNISEDHKHSLES